MHGLRCYLCLWLGWGGRSCPLGSGSPLQPLRWSFRTTISVGYGRGVCAPCLHRATLPPIRIVTVRTHGQSAWAFPLEVGSTQLARQGDLKAGFLLGPGAWWEQWVLPSESTGSAGSVEEWRRSCHFLWGRKLGPQQGQGRVQGSIKAWSATGQAGLTPRPLFPVCALSPALCAVLGHTVEEDHPVDISMERQA